MVHIHAEGPAFFCWIPKLFGKRVISTIHGLDWAREKWKFGVGSKFIRQGEKNAVKYADEIIVLSKGVQKYFMETYGRETHFIPNGVNRPEVREAKLITDHFGLEKDSYILFLGRLVPEKGIRYLVEAFKNVKTDKKLVIAGGSSDTDSFMEELKELAKGDDRILFTGFVQGAMLDELYSNAYIYTLPSDLEGIFLWKKSGMKEYEIAKKLSAQGIPTPFTRRCQLGYVKNTSREKNPAWQPTFVTKVLENPVYTGTMVYNRIAYDETYRKIGQNPRESWRMVPDSHPAIISWELFDEISALREAEQAVKEERKKWCRQRRKNNPNIFKGRIFCKKCGEKLVCHWQSDGTLYFYCASCHVSISEKDLWNGINKELHQRMEEHRDLQKLVRKSSGKSKLQSKEIATKREIEQASGNIVRLESQKRSGYEQYVLGKISKEKFLELKQDAENEIEAFRQTKAEKEKELSVVQEELQQKKQIAGNTEVLLTADNLQQYVKKVEVDCGKITYTEFLL